MLVAPLIPTPPSQRINMQHSHCGLHLLRTPANHSPLRRVLSLREEADKDSFTKNLFLFPHLHAVSLREDRVTSP